MKLVELFCLLFVIAMGFSIWGDAVAFHPKVSSKNKPWIFVSGDNSNSSLANNWFLAPSCWDKTLEMVESSTAKYGFGLIPSKKKW